MRKCIGIVCLTLLGQIHEPTLATEFSTLVRDLNAMQNRMALGDATAREAVARQFDAIENALSNSDPKTWSDEKNVRALIVYLLCGGESGAKERKIEIGATGKLAAILSASLLYAEGREGGVPKELMDIEPRGVPQVLGGHLALIQAGALTGNDDVHAVQLLDLARLLVPGSLVEEAALRREIAILDPVRDADKLVLLSLRYVSLYLKSPYAKNFWDAFQRATIQDDAFLSKSAKFLPIYDKAPPNIKVSTNLEVARQALIAGNFDLAQDSIEKAASAAVGQEPTKRIAFYRSILAALKEEHAQISLEKIDRGELSRDDSTLFAMASRVVSALSSRATGEEPVKDDSYEITTTVRRAIVESDDLLKRSTSR